MNKNKDCEIIKDLSSLYMENMLSEESQKFIETHLKNCKNCEKYYEDLNSTFLTEDRKEKNNDEIEINHLKKVANLRRYFFVAFSIYSIQHEFVR